VVKIKRVNISYAKKKLRESFPIYGMYNFVTNVLSCSILFII